jgi:hypothetical protein
MLILVKIFSFLKIWDSSAMFLVSKYRQESDRPTGRQAFRQTCIHGDRQKGTQPYKQTGRQACRHAGRQVGRQTGRQASDIRAYMQRDREADRHTSI